MTSRYEEIASNLATVQKQIDAAAKAANRTSDEITLIAVTKTFPISDVHILSLIHISEPTRPY